jgi:hypothetical protein
MVSNAVKRMADDLVPLEYVCARWAYSELLSNQPYHGSELKPLREKLARGVSFEELDTIERALLLRKWREVRGVPAFIKRLRGIAAFQLEAWTKERLGTTYVITNFAKDVSSNPLVDRLTFKQWIETEPIYHSPQGHARYAADGPAPAIIDPTATAGRWGGRTYLLDGYHRAVRFWKTQPSKTTFGVYVPAPPMNFQTGTFLHR